MIARIVVLVLWGIATAAQAAIFEPAKIIHREKSLYRDILVYEDKGLRCLKFGVQDVGRQSCITINNPDVPVLDYTRMQLAALYFHPEPKRVLVIGLGGGILPRALQTLYPEIEMDCVDIDPAVVKVARQYFGFVPAAKTRIVTQDGRVFVKRAATQARQYDLIVLDAFDERYVPEHMMTREFLQELNLLLAPKGVLTANTFSHSRLYDAESATFGAVFGNFYSSGKRARRGEGGNRVIYAMHPPLSSLTDLGANMRRMKPRLALLGVLHGTWLDSLSQETSWPANTRILTDKYSPGNVLD